jgi:hypothetical protein
MRSSTSRPWGTIVVRPSRSKTRIASGLSARTGASKRVTPSSCARSTRRSSRRLPEPAALPVVDDDQRGLGDAGPGADVAGHADPVAGVGVDGDERLVVVVVDVREVLDVARAQVRHRAEEPPVARLGAQTFEARDEQRAVVGLERPDVDARAVAERDGHVGSGAGTPTTPTRFQPTRGAGSGRPSR